MQVSNQRDLFGLLLAIAIEYKIDLIVVLSFPLTKYPATMCHPDGTICKTEKSVLTKLLKNMFVTSDVSEDPDVIIYDGFALIYTLKNVPMTFGKVSELILRIITKNTARRIDMIFDTYPTPSIKDFEHKLRGTRKAAYQISGRQQTRPSNFQ